MKTDGGRAVEQHNVAVRVPAEDKAVVGTWRMAESELEALVKIRCVARVL